VEQNKFKKCEYLGRVYPETSQHWYPPILEMLEKMDKVAVSKWTPRWFLKLVYKTALYKNGRVRFESVYKLFKKMVKIEITQIKSKFAGLRVYGDFPNEVTPMIQQAEIHCDLICENCGSMEQTRQVVVNRWVTNLCKNCKEHKNDSN
jgi:hypothetical protein